MLLWWGVQQSTRMHPDDLPIFICLLFALREAHRPKPTSSPASLTSSLIHTLRVRLQCRKMSRPIRPPSPRAFASHQSDTFQIHVSDRPSMGRPSMRSANLQAPHVQRAAAVAAAADRFLLEGRCEASSSLKASDLLNAAKSRNRHVNSKPFFPASCPK